MQWKSLILCAAIAESALARTHGHQRRQHGHGHAQEAHVAARDVEVEVHTVVNIEHVTLTTTVYGQPTEVAEAVTTTTSTTAEAATTTAAAGAFVEVDVDEDLAISASLGLSLSLGLGLGDDHTSTTTTSTSTSTEATTAASQTAASTTAASTTDSEAWTATPTNGVYSTAGFGARTNSSSSGVTYSGNVGSPWGSNIQEVSASEAWQYKYVIRMEGSNTADWFVSFWNKIGPDGKMDGWYGHSALNFTLAKGATKYVAFDENSQGGWGAAEGDSLPTDDYGGYSCTWGEFDFGDTDNDAWSGWDVSAIQAQNADQTVQGMRICQYSDKQCSYITTDAETVVNAYTSAEASVDGIGGTVSSGAVRLTVEIDYS
ncbi:hypothetical protein ASPBRDRAFT_133288 [Aspergillus brasiliensis CBS 101740]|uniref:Allergen Asp f 4 n=1 Tax=Aspergillus brasiliensis (strain CBS 101740 / IMI 381727 / IBT 21946) TaxID=767769 RepID=A0A1L9U9N7_ASPBC|nr:hypothetical protein ASPBRDRAFT_133288 [Aspergillus brasiliensis CBS 101740]